MELHNEYIIDKNLRSHQNNQNNKNATYTHIHYCHSHTIYTDQNFHYSLKGRAEEMGFYISFEVSCWGMSDREGKLIRSDRAKMGKCTLSLTFLVSSRDSKQID